MVKKLLLSSCLLVSSYVISRDTSYQDWRRVDGPCKCTFGWIDEEEEKKKEIAYRIGEDSVDFYVDIIISLGQGRLFQDLKRLHKRFEELVKLGNSLTGKEELREMIEVLFSRLPLRQRAAAVRGMIKGMEKINVQEFVEKARFDDWQVQIFKQMHEFYLKHLRAFSLLNPDLWDHYSNVHMVEYSTFFNTMSSTIKNELGIDATPSPCFPRQEAAR